MGRQKGRTRETPLVYTSSPAPGWTTDLHSNYDNYNYDNNGYHSPCYLPSKRKQLLSSKAVLLFIIVINAFSWTQHGGNFVVSLCCWWHTHQFDVFLVQKTVALVLKKKWKKQNNDINPIQTGMGGGGGGGGGAPPWICALLVIFLTLSRLEEGGGGGGSARTEFDR